MKKVKKPVFFIVLTIIVLFSVSVYTGFTTWYGDIETVHIKGLNDIRLGIDIQGGVDVTFTPEDDVDATDEQLDAAMSVIKLRLAALNINDSETYVDYNRDKLIVRFPWQAGEKDFDPEKAVKELGETAQLRFVEGYEQTGTEILTGAEVVKASATSNYDESGALQNLVALTLNDTGKTKFAEATSRLAGTQEVITIWMDDISISSATVSEAIIDGEAVISGNFSFEEAKNLADKINSGALPFELKTSSFKTISPTMGEGSLKAMLIGGLIAFALIVLYMIFAYRLPGFVASIALLGQVAGTLAVTSGYFGFMPSATLTIPGIAGIILTVGIGVDANIITAERIKEEIKSGKKIESALRAGYKRAFSAIFDGNITVMIVAVILMGAFGTPSSIFAKVLKLIFSAFGVSPEGTIYSFGYTLMAGVFLNFIMGVLASMLMLASLSKFNAFKNKKLYGGVEK